MWDFKPVGIDKYDGKTALAEWLRMYSTVVWFVGGDTFVMANYLPMLESAGRPSINSLPKGSVISWGDLTKKFVADF